MAEKSTILVIDDEQNLRRTLAFILERSNYQVVTVENGSVAVDNLEKSIFDLVFIDLHLPDIEGTLLAEEIHRLHPQIPIIILTGEPLSELETQKQPQIAAAYLAKPIDPAQILSKVKEVLEKNRVK